MGAPRASTVPGPDGQRNCCIAIGSAGTDWFRLEALLPGTKSGRIEWRMTVTATRIDAWLWAARFYKTRSLAKQAVETGKVEVDGQRAKPARVLRGGESLRIERVGELYEATVLGLSNSRGPASVAQLLYAESEESRARRTELRAQRAAERAGYHAPEHKPDKRARRLIKALGDIDAT
jgi:ribosome-associated heat shock protein Hsp15